MWIAFAIGWLLGSIGLYIYLVKTAREPQRGECMECHRSECTDCPHLVGTQQEELKRAA